MGQYLWEPFKPGLCVCVFVFVCVRVDSLCKQIKFV